MYTYVFSFLNDIDCYELFVTVQSEQQISIPLDERNRTMLPYTEQRPAELVSGNTAHRRLQQTFVFLQ